MHAENTHASLFDLFRRGQCAHNCGRRVDATRMLLVHAFGEHLPATEYLTGNHTAWFRSNTPKPFLTRTQGQKPRSLWVSNTDKWLRQSWQKFFEAEIPLRHCEAYTFAVPRDHRLVFGILVGIFDITGVENIRATEIRTFEYQGQLTAAVRMFGQYGAGLPSQHPHVGAVLFSEPAEVVRPRFC